MSQPTLFGTATFLLCAMCSAASAEPGHSLVQIVIEEDSAAVAVANGTRIDVVQAVVQSLAKADHPCAAVSVEQSLQYPPEQLRHQATTQHKLTRPLLTIYIVERGEDVPAMTYIATSANFPADLLCTLSDGLGEFGYDDIRLISGEALANRFDEYMADAN